MELINESLILFDLKAENKEEVVNQIAEAMDKEERLVDKTGYAQDVLKREEGSPTSIGFLIATPHAKSKHVKEPSLAFSRLEKPIEWAGEDVQLVFQIAVPDPGQGERHLEILAKLARKIISDEFRESLMNAKEKNEVLSLVNGL